jgi:hypothetical protein
MPVWAFEPEGDDSGDQDVLLNSGRLWGTDVLIEALRVESEQQPSPVRPCDPDSIAGSRRRAARGSAPSFACPAATAAIRSLWFLFWPKTFIGGTLECCEAREECVAKNLPPTTHKYLFQPDRP